MRRREREIVDPAVIDELIKSCVYLHLGLVDDGMPYVIPMNYGVEKDEKDGHYIIYLHSANEGRKLDIIRKNAKVCFTMEKNAVPFDGKVACQYGMTYECIMGTGKARIIDDPREKMRAMTVLMETQTDRKDFIFDDRMLTIVTAIRIDVETISAKKRPLPGTT
ncbi:MAG: pyridoxamine 5'-phosphate oxidase family protein [Lachnospiraceae bacterium]|nr:pyridoxamine 5'-phosphate oxidase family protein [Lachnospiraceae bacterium]